MHPLSGIVLIAAMAPTGTSVPLLKSVSCRSMAAYQETQMYRVGNRARRVTVPSPDVVADAATRF